MKHMQIILAIISRYKGIASVGLDESFIPLCKHLEIETNFCEATIKYFEHVINTAIAEDLAIAKSMNE